MKFLADESVDRPVVERLRQEGHQVSYVVELGPGMPDELVLHLANQESALLMTSDKDFGEMVFRQRLLSHGIVLMRLAGFSAEQKADMVAFAVREHFEELPYAFVVIAPGMVRVRRVMV
jgi:predicted nuclease of predicted toxin-antitoxin system